MLLQAVQDSMSNSTGKRASAVRWMNSTIDSGFSFILVCRVLARDPEQVRRFCQKKAALRRMPDLPFRAAFGEPLPAWRQFPAA